MSSRKELKKDIRFLTQQVILDALDLAEMVTEEQDKKKILDIIIEVTEMHNSLISKVNHPDGRENKKLVHEHFKAVSNELLTVCNKAYEQLNSLLPKS
ncbi:MAG: hypothetical protein JXR22_13390 [Prolixibacteraceae bacterium]|nr:hypothetical protein [Prolixibacteraceae bacterium]